MLESITLQVHTQFSSVLVHMSNHASTVLYKIFICAGADNESMGKHASTGSYKIFICVGADQERVHEFRLDQLLVVDHTQVLELVQGVDLS